jgi:hypothetical protein
MTARRRVVIFCWPKYAGHGRPIASRNDFSPLSWRAAPGRHLFHHRLAIMRASRYSSQKSMPPYFANTCSSCCEYPTSFLPSSRHRLCRAAATSRMSPAKQPFAAAAAVRRESKTACVSEPSTRMPSRLGGRYLKPSKSTKMALWASATEIDAWGFLMLVRTPVTPMVYGANTGDGERSPRPWLGPSTPMTPCLFDWLVFSGQMQVLIRRAAFSLSPASYQGSQRPLSLQGLPPVVL